METATCTEGRSEAEVFSASSISPQSLFFLEKSIFIIVCGHFDTLHRVYLLFPDISVTMPSSHSLLFFHLTCKLTSSDYSSSPNDHGHHSVRNDLLYPLVAPSFIDLVYPRCISTRH